MPKETVLVRVTETRQKDMKMIEVIMFKPMVKKLFGTTEGAMETVMRSWENVKKSKKRK